MIEWNEQQIETLRRMWLADATATKISAELGTTRNSVVGKAHRLGLPKRLNPVKEPYHYAERRFGPKESRPPKKPKKPKNAQNYMRGVRASVAKATQTLPVIKTGPIQIKLGKVSKCRWPEGDPKHPDFHFCEQPTHGGHPYCEAHCLRAYRQPEAA